ncbi:MAG: nickel-responsive transcriptional regulator NikR [bacterium]|nr:nickel-responsive transcriptional regulator NikR [bacterium]
MSQLTRFGVAMEDDLLSRFDELIRKKGYRNRSEAIRDLVREQMIQTELEDGGQSVFGAFVFTYDHHHRNLEAKLTELQHDHIHEIIATSHVHVDHDHCLEVILMKGSVAEVSNIAEKILSMKGVQHGKLTLTTSLPTPHHHSH